MFRQGEGGGPELPVRRNLERSVAHATLGLGERADHRGRDLDKDFNVMIKSPYAAAREAVAVWQGRSGKDGRKGTFIMTGNLLPKSVIPIATFTSLRIGKSGANYWVGTADGVLKEKGIRYVLFPAFFFSIVSTSSGCGPRATTQHGDAQSTLSLAQRTSFSQHLLMIEHARFFYADERTKDGGPVGQTPDGKSHTSVFLSLVEGKEDLPCYVTFVEGKYRKFD